MAALALLVGAAGPAAAGPAAADPAVSAAPSSALTVDGLPGTRISVDTPATASAAPHAQVSPTIFLNRCTGSCTVHKGTNDAQTDTTTIPMGTTGTAYTVHEFATELGATGAAANAEWAQVVQCMRDVYSPFAVTVTDVRPATGTYHEAIIAGSPGEIGYSRDVLGVAPLSSDCSAIDDVISFAFANVHAGTGAARVLNICWTAAQESAHAYGLDHEYSFTTGYAVDGYSACNDPMTYRDDCGGEKFFRNEVANCGETSQRACKCTKTQNSHQKLLSVFGAGTPITGVPTVALTSPVASGGMLGASVSAQAGARRGVSRVELFVNGFKWAQASGAAFLKTGQPDPSPYSVVVPAELPDSIVDVKVVAYDDLGASAESGVVTVTKGAPCTTASTCAQGQKCEAGRCFWDPPAGEIGVDCSYPQFCKSGLCESVEGGEQICTQACVPGVADSCPAGFACAASGSDAPSGTCALASTGGGCCSVGGEGTGWAPIGLAAAVIGWLTRRRRR